MIDRATIKPVLLTIGAIVLVGVVSGAGLIYSGLYNVAADKENSALKEWLLHTTMENSVASRLDEVPEPPPLDDPHLVVEGALHYDSMCADCHGAPGSEPGEIALGLNPPPPKLVDEAPEEDPRELFWVTKYGIEMTGMPGWGTSHDDEEIWGLVAVMKQFDDMTGDQYRQVVKSVKAQGHHGGVHHGPSGHGNDPGDHAHDETPDDGHTDHQHSDHEHSH